MVKRTTDKKLKQSVDKQPKDQEEMLARVSRGAMPAVLRVLVSVLFLVVFAGIFMWYILWQYNLGDIDKTIHFIEEKPTLTAYSYTVVLLVMCVIAAVTWRPFLTLGISFALSSILMYINTQKFAYRNAPLLPEDFLMADQTGMIMQFIDPWSVVRLIGGVVFVLVGSGILEYGVRRIFGRHTRNKAWWERHSILPRVAWTMVSLAGLMMFVRPILHYDDQNEEADSSWITGLKFEYWNQKEDFERNGFIIAFLYNLGRFQEAEPENYNDATIAEIDEKYTVDSDDKPSLKDVVDNVIVVLNESFYDPAILGGIYAYSGGDVTPNLHKIFEKYPSGYMFSPGYGGGTANVEFEVLTGLSNYWAQTTPYVTSLAKMTGIPGIVEDVTSDNFRATAIHPFDGSMYKRSVVYNRMGITTFLDQDTMTHLEHENGGGYVSDKEAYLEALDVIRANDDNHFVMIATMQNHMPYDAARYEKFNFTLNTPLYNASTIESYFETIHNGDKYLGEFVAELDKLEERTVMLWFGDHAPSIWTDYADSDDPTLMDLTHLTPYFVYANFDLDELYSEKEVAKLNAALGFDFDVAGVDLPVVTPNCLMSTLYDLLDVKKTSLVYLASEVCQEVPILTPAYSQGEREIEDSESEALRDYRLVNYDILSGKRYWLERE